MSNDNKQLVVRWFEEVWNQGSTAAIDTLLAGDCVLHGFGPAPQSSAQFKIFHATYRNAFPDVSITIDDIISEGSLVAVRWSGSGTHRGDALGFAATNRPATFIGMAFARIEDWKIVEGWNLFNQLGMLEQLGMVMRPE